MDHGRTEHPASGLTPHDVYLFREGTHARLYDRMGCRLDAAGASFAVWAPNAVAVSVIGDFNAWGARGGELAPRADGSGVWEGHIAGVRHGDLYKFRLLRTDGRIADKADPFAVCAESPPATASRAWELDYPWGDAAWMDARGDAQAASRAMSVYEVHLGSWRRPDDATLPGYREIAPLLVDYVLDMGFTHVEFMPLAEHPFYGSWGYQCTGYFAPSARYGTPEDFMFLIDMLHRAGIGVVLDWVSSHFPDDPHGLALFDGTHLYEHADPRQGRHPDWDSCIFNYGRPEVVSFLVSSASCWLDRYHIDALRVDAVASMLYLDYGRKAGEWIPNRHGGRENLEAIGFLRRMNEAVRRDFPDVHTIAEESSAWPMVTGPAREGGLGFGMKWNMGWMNDTLDYLRRDPIHRKFEHGRLTFSICYAFSENFVLPLSHDEVVYGKGSLIGRLPGNDRERFAGLRGLYGYMWGHPGKKLLFMGGEFGQRAEWTHEGQLDWAALQDDRHSGVRRWLQDLNAFYRANPAMHELDFDSAGFRWVDCDNADDSVLAFLRLARDGAAVLVVCNFTPVLRTDHVLGVPVGGPWREILNSDASVYGGSGVGNFGEVLAAEIPAHGYPWSLSITVPSYAALFFTPAAAPLF